MTFPDPPEAPAYSLQKAPMRTTAIVIGPAAACAKLERQLAFAEAPPVLLGRVETTTRTGCVSESARSSVHLACGLDDGTSASAPVAVPMLTPILGSLDELESIVARRKPSIAPSRRRGDQNRLLCCLRMRPNTRA